MFLLGKKGKGKEMYRVNFILSIARYAIWGRRNVMREKSCNINMWIFFRRKLEGHIHTLYNYFSMNGQVDKFYKILIGKGTRILECFQEYNINLPKEFQLIIKERGL